MTLDDAINRLSSGRGSIRCKELRRILGDLGFEIREGKKQGHFVVKHPGLKGWYGTDFACPHKSGDPVRKGHMSNVLNALKQREGELRELLGEPND